MRGRREKHPSSTIEFSISLLIGYFFESFVAQLVIDEAIPVKLFEVAVQKYWALVKRFGWVSVNSY